MSARRQTKFGLGAAAAALAAFAVIFGSAAGASQAAVRAGGPTAAARLPVLAGGAQAPSRAVANQRGRVHQAPTGTDRLINNNAGATTTCCFTQSETTLTAFGSTLVAGFNDSGSYAGGTTNKFTGFSRSTDGGNTWVDGGTLPTSAIGDAGDPQLARDSVTGRIYFATLGFDNVSAIPVFHSDDTGITWSAPVNGTPGGGDEDKDWITVDNFPGAGQGNVYLVVRDFGGGNGIYLFRSTDGGNTFGPSGGTLIVPQNQGANVVVGPDHSVYVFYWTTGAIQMRKSTDLGITFGAPVNVALGLIGGVNGDLSLLGVRNGTAIPSGFRSNEFPQAVVNPVNGNLYATFDNKGIGVDKADVFLTQSTDGGATWSAPVKINDDVTTTDQWSPTLAVSPDGAFLGSFYYSRQEDPVNNNMFKFYGRVATITGSTVSYGPSFAISDVPSLPEFGRDSVVNSVYMGDYDEATATPGFFHVTWSDSRSPLAGGDPRMDPNVYYDNIPLTAPPPPTCMLTATIAGPPKQIQITVQAAGGLASVTVDDSTNAVTPVPPFTVGTTAAVVITSTKLDQSSGAHVALTVAGVNGGSTTCDPVVPGAKVHFHPISILSRALGVLGRLLQP